MQIVSLPAAGQLLLNGVAVAAGQFVPATEIALGHLTFAPAADANGGGYASFSFQVQDDGGTANGGVDLDPTPNTITVNVTPVNDAPAANDDSYVTAEDTPLIIAAPGVLANDTDVESDPLTATKLTDPAHGTLTLNPDGSFTYTPDANYGGADSFTYTVDDGQGGTATATVNLTVTPVADAPTLTTAPVTGNVNTAIPLTVATALVDIDGSETLALQIGAIPVGATLSDGTNSFTATAGNTTVDVSAWTLSALTITPPAERRRRLHAHAHRHQHGDRQRRQRDHIGQSGRDGAGAALHGQQRHGRFRHGDGGQLHRGHAVRCARRRRCGDPAGRCGGGDRRRLRHQAGLPWRRRQRLHRRRHARRSPVRRRGNDTIRGGAGNDTLDGGADSDTIDYSTASAGVTINMATGAVTGGAGSDALTGFENIIGSGFADVVTGVSGGIIDLGAGADSLTLVNGTNSVTVSNTETITGGTGADTRHPRRGARRRARSTSVAAPTA